MHGAEGRVGVYGGVQGRWSAVGVGEGGVGMWGGQSGGGGWESAWSWRGHGFVYVIAFQASLH